MKKLSWGLFLEENGVEFFLEILLLFEYGMAVRFFHDVVRFPAAEVENCFDIHIVGG